MPGRLMIAQNRHNERLIIVQRLITQGRLIIAHGRLIVQSFNTQGRFILQGRLIIVQGRYIFQERFIVSSSCHGRQRTLKISLSVMMSGGVPSF